MGSGKEESSTHRSCMHLIKAQAATEMTLVSSQTVHNDACTYLLVAYQTSLPTKELGCPSQLADHLVFQRKEKRPTISRLGYDCSRATCMHGAGLSSYTSAAL